MRPIYLLFFTCVLLSCSSKRSETKKYLDSTNQIKSELDQIDSAIYHTYLTTFLRVGDSLYNKHNSTEFKQFINDADQKYSSYYAKIDSLQSEVSDLEVQQTLKNIVTYQKEGLSSYYTTILMQEKVDVRLDSIYNSKFKQLEKRLFIAQINLAKRNNINIKK